MSDSGCQLANASPLPNQQGRRARGAPPVDAEFVQQLVSAGDVSAVVEFMNAVHNDHAAEKRRLRRQAAYYRRSGYNAC
eukprot:8446542-Alexandrium_andersonii.AAC.1